MCNTDSPYVCDAEDDEEDVYDDEKRKIDLLCGSDKPQMIPLNVEERSVKKPNKSDIAYKLEDVPPWYLCFALGLQHYLTMFGGTVSYPYLIAPKLCIPDDSPARGYLISSTFFVSGLATFIQTTFGVRLPIVQGSTVALLVPIIAILQLPQWQCPTVSENMDSLSVNESASSSPAINWDEVWMERMREVQGAIIGASLFEVVIGFTGLMGFLLTWITPLAIVPTVTLVGLSLFMEAANSAAGHWGIAFFTMFLLVLFSQFLRDFDIPLPVYTRGEGFSINWFPFFKLFPVLCTILLAWGLCAILTVTDELPEGDSARTDLHLNLLEESKWFRFPYPGQWGVPTFSTAGVFGVLAGVLASAIESVGDYYACARLAGAPPPPKHAINRGIWAEGIGCVLGGLWGIGGGLTSYSENIGAIGITKVASRRVIQYGAALMIVFGMLGKVGALFVTIPEPIIGGLFCVMFSMIAAVGLSTLHFVDLTSSRNLFVLGFSLFMGFCIPKWMEVHPGVVDTGNDVLTQIVTVLLGTSMFVGGFLGFLLDNAIPGTDEERGVLKWKEQEELNTTEMASQAPSKVYDLPFIMPFLRRVTFFKYLPISPTYSDDVIKRKLFHLKNCFKSKKRTRNMRGEAIPNEESIHI